MTSERALFFFSTTLKLISQRLIKKILPCIKVLQIILSTKHFKDHNHLVKSLPIIFAKSSPFFTQSNFIFYVNIVINCTF